MAGYDGRSMSNNAVEAYKRGEKPISRWKKIDIINYIEEYVKNNRVNFSIDLLKKVKLEVLKDKLLKFTGWHHTGYKYKRTEFYGIDENDLKELSDEKIKGWL